MFHRGHTVSSTCLQFAIAAVVFIFPFCGTQAADAPKPQSAKVEPSKSEPKRIKQAANGSIVLPARDVEIHGTTVRYEPDKNTIGYWTKQEDWVSWELEIVTPGTFTIDLLAGCGAGSGGSHYTVEIADQKLQDKVQDTGSFHNFRVRRVGEVKIDKPGNYTFSVRVDDKPGHAVMDLRQVVLAPPKPKKETAFTPGKPAGDMHESILLWFGVAPGDKPGEIGEEKDTSPGSGIIRLGNVTKPMITIFRPAADKDTGAAVIVCPGGGYNILAYDLEGTEVCDWLNSIGVTGVLLKYRVPGRGGERHTAPLQDAQRAIGLVRSKAAEWKLDPKRIGILGFSAGGHLSATASNNYDSRTYPPVDDADKTSCRPDFTILIYPAYLTLKDNLTKLAPEIKVTKETPPAFVAMTADDPVHVQNVYAYGLGLIKAGVPGELHVYLKGGHGYGLRPSENAVSHWPDRAAEWMKGQGLLNSN